MEPFERAILTIGNNERLVTDYPDLEHRQKLLDTMFELFAGVIGEREWQGRQVSKELAISSVMEKLRDVLGISELTAARAELIKRAVKSLEISP